MAPGHDGGQVFQVLQRICAVSCGQRTAMINCRAELAEPLDLSEDALWNAIDALLAAGFVAPAQQSGVQIHLTAQGVQWCLTLPRRMAIARTLIDTR